MAITDLDEQLLVRAHQAGDEHAFQQIVRSQHRALYAHAHRRLGNHEAAEDAVQDTLLRAYRALPSFDGDLRLRAWLHRILTNVCHDESNRRKRQVGLIDKLEAQPFELAPDPIDEAVLHDTVRIMNSALAELPESYREALVLRYVDGLSFREVAEITGVSEENARARVHRGRLALHKVLSRVTVMVAFLVPGLRRTQKALDVGGDSVATTGASEHTVSLTTQLVTHAYTAAPVINRVAVESSAFMAAKSSAVATAVAAVAAVAAPVAAYSIYDTAKTPDRPPAAVALPADDTTATTTATTIVVGDIEVSVPTPPIDEQPTTTVTTIPDSAAHPFETGVTTLDGVEEPTSPSTTAAPAPDPDETITATLGGSAFDVTGVRPDFELRGPVTITGAETSTGGDLAGRVFVADAPGGETSAELTLVLEDGREYRVRFRGTLEAEESTDGAVTWTMRGAYSVPSGEELSIADTGTATVVFRVVDGGPSSISFDLQSQQQSD